MTKASARKVTPLADPRLMCKCVDTKCKSYHTGYNFCCKWAVKGTDYCDECKPATTTKKRSKK